MSKENEPVEIRALIYKEGGHFIVQDVDYEMVAQGVSFEQAMTSFAGAVLAEFFLAGISENAMFSNPSAVPAKFATLYENAKGKRHNYSVTATAIGQSMDIAKIKFRELD